MWTQGGNLQGKWSPKQYFYILSSSKIEWISEFKMSCIWRCTNRVCGFQHSINLWVKSAEDFWTLNLWKKNFEPWWVFIKLWYFPLYDTKCITSNLLLSLTIPLIESLTYVYIDLVCRMYFWFWILISLLTTTVRISDDCIRSVLTVAVWIVMENAYSASLDTNEWKIGSCFLINCCSWNCHCKYLHPNCRTSCCTWT